ncbi:ankyrin repeat-containing domain protein, partial [Mycena floridula]
LLLQHPNIQPGLADKNGWTPLMCAYYYEHLEMAKLLISHEKSIPLNFVYKDGQSELHIAVCSQNVALVHLLLQHSNIQPGLADKDGWTRLMHACSLPSKF